MQRRWNTVLQPQEAHLTLLAEDIDVMVIFLISVS